MCWHGSFVAASAPCTNTKHEHPYTCGHMDCQPTPPGDAHPGGLRAPSTTINHTVYPALNPSQSHPENCMVQTKGVLMVMQVPGSPLTLATCHMWCARPLLISKLRTPMVGCAWHPATLYACMHPQAAQCLHSQCRQCCRAPGGGSGPGQAATKLELDKTNKKCKPHNTARPTPAVRWQGRPSVKQGQYTAT